MSLILLGFPSGFGAESLISLAFPAFPPGSLGRASERAGSPEMFTFFPALDANKGVTGFCPGKWMILNDKLVNHSEQSGLPDAGGNKKGHRAVALFVSHSSTVSSSGVVNCIWGEGFICRGLYDLGSVRGVRGLDSFGWMFGALGSMGDSASWQHPRVGRGYSGYPIITSTKLPFTDD